MTKILAVLMLTLSCAAARGVSNWPQFRGPDGSGHSDSRGLPVQWGETRNVVIVGNVGNRKRPGRKR